MARDERMTALVFDDVHAAYGPYKALNGLSFTVAAGEAVAILGRNGVGKSTLARVASGLVPVSTGRLEVLGRTVHRTAAHVLAKDGVVHLPEGVGLFTGLTVEENLVLRVGGRTRADRRQRLARAVEELGELRDRRHAKAGHLSGGQQRLVAVAAAIAAEPRLLIADEPALGLAPAAADAIYAALAKARGEASTLVVIETRLDRVRPLCSRAIVLDSGVATYDATIDDGAQILAALLGTTAPAIGDA